MKIAELRTTTDAKGVVPNGTHKGLIYNFRNLFINKTPVNELPFLVSVPSESSRFYKTQVQLAGTGLRAKATVLFVRETGLLINRDPIIAITIRFNNIKKGIREITAKTVVPRIAIPRTADNITIAYSPNNLSVIAVL